MNSTSIQAELASLFEQRNFQSILDRAQQDEISPANNPHAAHIVAAALFQVGRYSDCLLWCEGLSPALNGDASFTQCMEQFRRTGRLEEAEKIFRVALETNSDNPFLRNNFANLLIDRESFDGGGINSQESSERKNPDYEDAKANLNRLKFQRNLTESAPRSDRVRSASQQFE